MKLSLSGKLAVVAGGSRGIGYCCADLLVDEGATVVLIARDSARLTERVATLKCREGNVQSIACDLGSASETAEAISLIESSFGPVNILINAAGSARRIDVDDLTIGDYQAALQAKYLTYMNAMAAVLPRMASRRSGSIVNIVGSSALRPGRQHVAAGAANAALLLAGRGLANAYAFQGIRINNVNPGIVKTERFTARVAEVATQNRMSQAEAEKTLIDGIPMGRGAEPVEVARVAVFLASGAASYVTGATVSVDGGLDVRP